ncbi:hypothetical protein [Vibrio crassostreae]|uniref:hypothetical protein n=1 Tax=Vibrio crassostreae TaxID=246167 RepID=UPI001B301ED1|nr:hypothetical protein [Vibrio crassostreae]
MPHNLNHQPFGFKRGINPMDYHALYHKNFKRTVGEVEIIVAVGCNGSTGVVLSILTTNDQFDTALMDSSCDIEELLHPAELPTQAGVYKFKGTTEWVTIPCDWGFVGEFTPISIEGMVNV